MIVFIIRLDAQQLVEHPVGLAGCGKLGLQGAQQADGTVGLGLTEAVGLDEDVGVLVRTAGKDDAGQKHKDAIFDDVPHIHGDVS